MSRQIARMVFHHRADTSKMPPAKTPAQIAARRAEIADLMLRTAQAMKQSTSGKPYIFYTPEAYRHLVRADPIARSMRRPGSIVVVSVTRRS